MARSRSNPGSRKIAKRTSRRDPLPDLRTALTGVDATVRRLTEQILELTRRGAAQQADLIVEIGRRMDAVKQRLDRGQWVRWLAEAVPFDRRSATNYMALARFAEQHPDDFDRFKSLGPSKLYLLAAIPPDRRERFRTHRPLPIPGAGRSKPVMLMTVVELASAIGGLAVAPNDAIPIDKVVQGYRHKLAGLEAATRELLERSDELNPELAQNLHASLLQVAAQLEQAFDL